MTPNPALKKLGFGPEDRVVILHADDIGMCHARLGAYADLVDFGLMSSAATMVPCPWFLAAAEYCRDHPQVDMGVHLTLNSEWRVYRWKPLSTSDPATGLIDDQGYFHHRQGPVVEHAQVGAVNAELRAIAPDWQSRVANYRTFTSPELRDFVKDRGIQVIGYRPLQELMPAA